MTKPDRCPLCGQFYRVDRWRAHRRTHDWAPWWVRLLRWVLQ